MKNLKTYIAGAGITLMAPLQVLAANPFETSKNMVANVGNAAGIQTTNGGLTDIIGKLINIFLGFLGVIFLVLMLYAGFLWMTAQGEEAKVKRAKDMITQAIIGLIIVVAAFAISNFVLESLLKATGNG